MSDSFIMLYSLPSILTSVPDHFPNNTISPTFTSIGVIFPSSFLAKNEDGKITPMDVKVGDIVLFGKWSGTEVKIDGKEYSIMKESDIMGISKSKK